MHASWITDFLRSTLLTGKRGLTITEWCHALVDILHESKDEHEIHIMGVNRAPKMANFFLASSTERGVRNTPIPITLTKKTGELFLAAPTNGTGIRLLKEELPMTISYLSGTPPKKHEIPFYDALCFDFGEYTIAIGLVIPEGTLEDFFSTEEISELMPLVRCHAIPLLEAHTLRYLKAQQDADVDQLLNLMRQSNPEFGNRVSASQAGIPKIDDSEEKFRSFDAGFLMHVAQEFRAPLMKITATLDQLIELSQTSLGSPELTELAQATRNAALLQQEMLRSLTNIATLSQPDVKPRVAPFPMQGLIRELYPAAVQSAARHQVEIKLQEYTRNIFVNGDQKTLVTMCERLFAFTIPFAQGGKLWIRTDDNPERVEKGFVSIEIEDSGQVPRDVSPAKLLTAEQMARLAHPRLRKGGGMLYQLIQLFLEKSGGKFKLGYGSNDGFCVYLILPLIGRAEMEKIKEGEIGS